MTTTVGHAQIVLTANTASFTQNIDNSRSALDNMKTSAIETANKLKAGFATVTVAVGAVSSAVGFLVKDQYELANALTKTAQIANTSAVSIQKHVVASKALGIEQDKLGDIFKDTQDKIGDFLTTEGGELEDFFKNIAPQVNLTAEELRNLSGPDALQAVYNALEKANLSQSEMVFYMESIADEASLLIPLLKNGGEGFRLWGEMAENAGATMDEKTIRATQELKTSTELLSLSYQGIKNQIARAVLPVLSDMAGSLTKDANLKNQASKAGEILAYSFKMVVGTGIAVVGTINAIGKGIGALIATFSQFGTITDGVDWSSPMAFLTIGKNALSLPKNMWQTLQIGWEDIKSSMQATNKSMDNVLNWGSGGRTNSTISTLTDITNATENYRAKLGQTGAELEKVRKAEEEAKKEQAKQAKQKTKDEYKPLAVNSTVLAHAKQFNYAQIEKQYGLPQGLLSAVSMQESRGNPQATSPVGAKGEFQFMPATAKRFGIGGQERDTQKASVAAAKYLSYLYGLFGDWNKAIAGYNAGEGNVKKYGGIPPFKETQNYVKQVRGYLAYMNGGASVKSTPNDMIANQAQLAEQQANARLQIEKEFADKKMQMKIAYEEKIKQIEQAGFDDARKQQYLEQAKKDYDTEVLLYENAQQKKLDAFLNFKRSEKDIIADEYYEKGLSIYADKDLSKEQKQTAISALMQERDLKLQAIDLAHDKEQQSANAKHQTAVENIKTEAELQRRELALNVKMDSQLRQARLDAINHNEQEALRQIKERFENELASITDYSKSEIQRLKDEFFNKRNAIDSRTDIGDDEKSQLRNALTGQFIHDKGKITKGYRDEFLTQQAGFMGTNEYLELENSLTTQKENLDKWRANEAISDDEWKAGRLQAEKNYLQAKNALTLNYGEQMAGNMAGVLKNIAGENSRAYRTMFAIEKGFAIARSIMAIQTAIAQASANPFPMNLGAMATVASQVASIVSNIQAVRMPIGQAHDGIMSVPKSGTWNLEKGERVLPKHTAKALDDRLDKFDKKGNTPNIIINNYSGEKAEVSQQPNGDLLVIIGQVVDAKIAKNNRDQLRQGGANYGR